MRTTVDDLLTLARAPTPAGYARAAAFDADHTLWHGDIGDLAFAAAAPANLLSEAMFSGPVAAWAAAIAYPLPNDRREFAPQLLQDVASGHFAAHMRSVGVDDDTWRHQLYEMQAFIFADQPRAAIEELAAELFEQGLARGVFADMRRLLDGLAVCDVQVLIASASHGALVQVGARHLGLSPQQALGMEPSDTPPAMRLSTYGAGKRDAVIAHLNAPPWLAFGDSVLFTDRALLEAAHTPVAVLPRGPHRAAAEAHPRMLLLDPLH
jgi:phosphoserine phosphatase